MPLLERLAAYTNQGGIILRKKGGYTVRVKASSGSASIFITALVTIIGETAGTPEVDLCAKGEIPTGIIIGPADTALDLSKDSDSCFADGTYLAMWVFEPGEEFIMTAKTNSAIAWGARCQVDGGYLITFAYTDTAEATDTMESVIAQNIGAAITATASTEKLGMFRIIGGG